MKMFSVESIDFSGGLIIQHWRLGVVPEDIYFKPMKKKLVLVTQKIAAYVRRCAFIGLGTVPKQCIHIT